MIYLLLLIIILCFIRIQSKESYTPLKQKKRGVVVYVPNKPKYINELKLVKKCFDINNLWKDTDLIVFCPQEILNKMPQECITVPFRDVENDTYWYNKDTKQHYKFMNSIDCIFSPQAEFLKDYTYLLRTDTDIFLTPAFQNWHPDRFTTGKGYYCNNVTKKNLKNLAKKMKYTHHGIHDVGSTWYGKSEDIIKMSQLTSQLTHYIWHNEFPNYKPKWPDWYRGVSLLYGGEIAANHLFGTNFDNGKLDYPSKSTDAISAHPHIHCLQDNTDFSKLKFQKGAYNNVKVDDTSTIKNYCINVASQVKV